ADRLLADGRHDADRSRARRRRGPAGRTVAVPGPRRRGHGEGDGAGAPDRRERGDVQLRRDARAAAHRRHVAVRRPVRRVADGGDRTGRARRQGPHARLPRGQGAQGAQDMTRYRDARVGACLQAEYRRVAGGIELLRSTTALEPFPDRLTDRLEQWARIAPERTLAARRERGGDWRRIGYAQMLERARAVGQALVERGLSAERPVAILSGNDLEHLSLALGAMWAGVPYAPISPAYSLVSQDYGKLRHILNSLTPGLVFASGPEYAKAIRAVVDPDIELVLAEGRVDGRAVTPFDALLATTPGARVDDAHARTGPDTIAKFLFTSGSTRVPKGVVNTQRMLCANQQMICQGMAFLADEPPVLVDWLPWNHTFGGNHNTGITIYN